MNPFWQAVLGATLFGTFCGLLVGAAFALAMRGDASRIEAQRGETVKQGSISEADESLTAESGDAQAPKSVTKGA